MGLMGLMGLQFIGPSSGVLLDAQLALDVLGHSVLVEEDVDGLVGHKGLGNIP